MLLYVCWIDDLGPHRNHGVYRGVVHDVPAELRRTATLTTRLCIFGRQVKLKPFATTLPPQRDLNVERMKILLGLFRIISPRVLADGEIGGFDVFRIARPAFPVAGLHVVFEVETVGFLLTYSEH